MQHRDDSNVSVLIVDDNAVSRFLMSVILGKEYSCETAQSAEEAHQLLGSRHFDVLITGVELSGSSGLDLCKAAKQKSPDLIVVIVSAFQQYRAEAIKRGAFEFLLKPVDVDRLQIVIKQAVIARDFDVTPSV